MIGVTRLRRPKSQLDHPLTEEYVHAGKEVITEALEKRPDKEKVHPFLAGVVPQKKLVARVNKRGRQAASEGSLRDRWEKQGHYVHDLIDHIRLSRVVAAFRFGRLTRSRNRWKATSSPRAWSAGSLARLRRESSRTSSSVCSC
jgi:hypothetical protein